ncbi:MAG TPA: hypothetical protein VMH01_17485 [Puia sp.]|nr:hypothetical protein [Puia sp.]
MKGNRLVTAIFKSLLCMAGIFLIGFLGYHYPDAMIVVVAVGVGCAFTWYFYIRQEDV